MLRSTSKCCSSSFRRIPAAAPAASLPQRGFAASTKPGPREEPQTKDNTTKTESTATSNSAEDPKPKPRKTMAELDEELKQKMSGLAGDGGESGVEYEDGQPVAMKRGVKDNMFRYI